MEGEGKGESPGYQSQSQ